MNLVITRSWENDVYFLERESDEELWKTHKSQKLAAWHGCDGVASASVR